MLRLNPELYAALEKWAADEFRSVNGQIEWILDRTLKEHNRQARGKAIPATDTSRSDSTLRSATPPSTKKGTNQSNQHADQKKK